MVVFPISSKPKLQVYIAMSPIELPLNVTVPLSMTTGSSHSAAKQESFKKNAKMKPTHILCARADYSGKELGNH